MKICPKQSFFLSFIDANNVSYWVLCNNVFLYYYGASLQHNFETNHLRFKERVIEYFKCRHDELSKSQKWLQLF